MEAWFRLAAHTRSAKPEGPNNDIELRSSGQGPSATSDPRFGWDVAVVEHHPSGAVGGARGDRDRPARTRRNACRGRQRHLRRPRRQRRTPTSASRASSASTRSAARWARGWSSNLRAATGGRHGRARSRRLLARLGADLLPCDIAASIRLVRAIAPTLPALSRSAVGRTVLLAQLSARPGRSRHDMVATELASLRRHPDLRLLVRDLAKGPEQQGPAASRCRAGRHRLGPTRSPVSAASGGARLRRHSRPPSCTGFPSAVISRCGTVRTRRCSSSSGRRQSLGSSSKPIVGRSSSTSEGVWEVSLGRGASA